MVILDLKNLEVVYKRVMEIIRGMENSFYEEMIKLDLFIYWRREKIRRLYFK